jgi:hypothetical protein
VGWRSWLVVEEGEGARLSSVVYPTVWPPRCELVAVCKRRRYLRRRLSAEEAHDAPEERCQCGIYAASDPTRLVPYLTGHAAEVRASGRLLGRVAGRVLLWGRVVECEQGWRGSQAYPERIYVRTGGEWPLLDGAELARRLSGYGVPIQPVACATLSQLAAALAREAEAA